MGRPNPNAPSLAGISLTIWLVLLGMFVMWVFLHWERHVARTGGDPLVRPGFMRNPPLAGGVIMFFFQYLLQGGYFFIVPLFLSVVLELTDALETGVRLVPLSITR